MNHSCLERKMHPPRRKPFDTIPAVRFFRLLNQQQPLVLFCAKTAMSSIANDRSCFRFRDTKPIRQIQHYQLAIANTDHALACQMFAALPMVSLRFATGMLPLVLVLSLVFLSIFPHPIVSNVLTVRPQFLHSRYLRTLFPITCRESLISQKCPHPHFGHLMPRTVSPW